MTNIKALLSPKFFFTFYFPAVVIFGFQNCSDVGFKTESSQVEQLLGSDLVIENGFKFTNKKVVTLEINANGEIYPKMRISNSPDFSDAELIDFKSPYEYDLKDEYASDGSKDGVKSIYVELVGENVPVKVMNQNIGLDTVFPNIIPQGILADGLVGEAPSFQDVVNLFWDAHDVPASTGFTSGIDAQRGLRIAYSKTNDCSSSNVTLIQDWGFYSDSFGVNWPQKNPIDSLYFCIYVQDHAGNSKSYTSQPMTSLWKVLVGENAQGNGGHYLSPSVRFKKPAFLAKYSRGNMFINDESFNNIRVISSESSTTSSEISLFFGDGRLAVTG